MRSSEFEIQNFMILNSFFSSLASWRESFLLFEPDVGRESPQTQWELAASAQDRQDRQGRRGEFRLPRFRTL